MNLSVTDRGFERVEHPDLDGQPQRLVQQSSAVGEHYNPALGPDSSFLWVGEHHLDRMQVGELARRLRAWLETGSLALPGEREVKG